MNTHNTLKRFFGSLASAAAVMIFVLTSVGCSSDSIADDLPVNANGDSFLISIVGSKNSSGSNTANTMLRSSGGNESSYGDVYLVNKIEDIDPLDWNDPLGESYCGDFPQANGRHKTQYSHDPVLNYLSVRWKSGDQVGIKTLANAANNTAAWTRLDLTEGDGNVVADFSGLASNANGLQQTGSQDIIAVYPYSATGSYDFSTQPGVIGSLGDYDVRYDQGTMVNSKITDLYFETKIAVLRIDKTFFDLGSETKTLGKTELTVSVAGAGIGSSLTNVLSNAETVTAGTISATVAVDRTSGKPVEDVYLAFMPIDTDEAEFRISIQSGSDASTFSQYVFYKSHFAAGTMYNLRHPGTDISEQCIEFEDDRVAAILIQNFDTNRNGCISYREARSVTYFGTIFENTSIRWFDEFKEFTSVSLINSNMFNGCADLQRLTLPADVEMIDRNAFNNCINLESIGNSNTYPKITGLGVRAFNGCRKLSNVSFPAVTTIAEQAFSGCASFTEVNFPVCTSIGNLGFSGCTNLLTADFPACVTVGTNVFSSCALTSVNLPVCTTLDSYAFENCLSLTSVDFPACTFVGYNCFDGCFNLSSATLRSCTKIGNSAFASVNQKEGTITLKTGCDISQAYIPSAWTIIYVD